jgi:twinkle protein
VHSDELKELLGQSAKNIIAQGLGFRPNKAGFVLCPLHSEKTASMSWFKDGLMWRCNGCRGHIDIYRYYTEFENMSFVQAKEKVMDITGQTEISIFSSRANKKEYSLPKIRMRELSQEAIDLMAIRKLTKETLEAWKVKESTWNGSKVYVYQYFHNDILKHVTYREVKAGGFKGGCEKNTEPILWGMWHVEEDKPLVITEGQPDAMAIWQSGYKNVVSAPSGANNLTWIETCWEWLKGREIIVWTDNDKRGLEFADNVRRRLSNVKIIVADRLKDANEVMYIHGTEKVLAMINDAIREMPNGLLDMAQVEYDVRSVYENGIETGFFGYDSFVGDWKEKDLTVIFGRNGEGKTTFVSQIIAHCLEKGVKTFLYSGEMSEFKIQDWLYKQLVGNKKEYMDQVQTKYKTIDVIKPEIIKRIKEWHEGLFYLFDRREEGVANDLDKFFELMELAAKKYGVKLFVIDNLMSKLEENADSLNSDQANFVQRCKFFAINTKAHIVLVAHPNKAKGEITGNEGNLGKLDISGSNNIPNKADNIIAVERVWGENRECDAIVTSLKDREVGQRKVFNFLFSQKTLRFYNGSTCEGVKYGWEKTFGHEVEIPIDCPWDIRERDNEKMF